MSKSISKLTKKKYRGYKYLNDSDSDFNIKFILFAYNFKYFG